MRVIFEYVFVFFDFKILTYCGFNHYSGTRAVGIEYVDDTIGRAKGTTEPLVARASRLVVLSAGAFGSPAVLERSGVGSKDILSKNNIQQLVDLPGVGEHYMGSSNQSFNPNDNALTVIHLDHNLVGIQFLASEDAETMDKIFWGSEEEVERMYAAALTMHCKLSDVLFVLAHEKRWLHDGKGLLASKSVSVVFIYLQCPLTSY